MTFLSNPEHVMLDIESMSLHQTNALILSIGMKRFDPFVHNFNDCLGESSLLIPSIPEQLLIGREVSTDTQKFWKAQKPEAAAHWRDYNGAPDTLIATCNRLANFVRDARCVWANGILFDLGNIEGLFRQVMNTGAPWHYRAPRDMRTFCEETPITRGNEHDGSPSPLEQFDLTPHEPVSDCITQIYRVWEHWPNGKGS